MSMIKRVARAMCVPLGINPDDWHETDGVRVYAWELEIDQARAAIEAMREPTDSMGMAGAFAIFEAERADREIANRTGEYPNIPSAPWEAWKSMIDAALKV